MSASATKSRRPSKSQSLIPAGAFQSGSALYSSQNPHWATPPSLFAALDAEFHFTVDVCCQPATAKCRKYYTPVQDGLKQSWANERAWMNPPYGREISAWMEKAAWESRHNGATVVALVPSRTGPRWWQKHVIGENAKVTFLPGRINFWLNGAPGKKAPFDSAVVIYLPGR